MLRILKEFKQLGDYLNNNLSIAMELDQYDKEKIHKLYKDAGCSLLAELYQTSLDKTAVKEKISEFKRKMYDLRRMIITMSLNHLTAVINSLNSVFFAVENEYTFVVHPKVGLFAATFPHKVLWNVGYLLPCLDEDEEFVKVVMCEEGFHWIFDHHSRGVHLLKSTSGMTPNILDIASDMSMYALLRDIAGDKADEYIDEHDKPQTHGFDIGLSFERYALLLRDKYYQEMLQQQQNNKQGGEDGDQEGQEGKGNSGMENDSDNGQPRDSSSQGGEGDDDNDSSQQQSTGQGGGIGRKNKNRKDKKDKSKGNSGDGQGNSDGQGDKDGEPKGGSSEVNKDQLNQDHLSELSDEARRAILRESKGTVVVVVDTANEGEGEGKSGKSNVADVKAVAGQALASLTETLKQRGLGTGCLDQMLPRVKVKKMNWRAIIQDVFIRLKKEYSWAKPEKRLYVQGITIPSEFPIPSLPHIVLSFDQSGSMNDYECAAAAQWTIDLAKKFNFQKITLLVHDTQIVHKVEIESEMGTKLEDELFRRRTACGTDHADVLKWIYENQKEYPPIAVYIGFTDGYSSFEGLDKIDPSIRVVWVISRNDDFTIDRGLVVHTDVLWDDK